MVACRGFKRCVVSPDAPPVSGADGGNGCAWWALALQGAGVAVYLAALAWVRPGPVPSVEQALAEQAVELAGALEQEVESALTRLHPVARQVAGGEPFDWRLFSRALDPTAGPRGGGLIVWAPQVPAAARGAYELQTGRDTFRSFSIRDPDGRGGLRPAGRRAEHFPVHLIDPPAENSRLLGLDLLSEPAIAEAIGRAGRSRLPQVSLPPPLAIAPAQRRLVIVLPVARGPQLQGVLVAALPLPARPVRADCSALAPELTVRLAPWTPAPRPATAAASRPPGPRQTSARAPFHVRGQTWAVEIAARRR